MFQNYDYFPIDKFDKPPFSRWVDYISGGTRLWKISKNLLILVGLYQELAYAWVVTRLLVCEEPLMRGRWRDSCSPAASRMNSAEPRFVMTVNWTLPPSVTCRWIMKMCREGSAFLYQFYPINLPCNKMSNKLSILATGSTWEFWIRCLAA